MGKRKRRSRAAAADTVRAGSAVGWVTLIYFCSGTCSLMDEVVWVRLLKLTLGNTVYASSIVVSVFMGGLALGALVMGRYADLIRRRLRLYAILEALATVSALSLPWTLRLADRFYRWFYATYEPPPGALLVVQVFISAAILLVPSVVMGSTLPLLGRYVTSLRDRVGRLVGRLYALNMLGAVLGCFLAGFVLIRTVGVMASLYIAAGINLLVAAAGWVLSRSGADADMAAAKVAPAPRRGDRPGQTNDRRQYLLVAAFFASGLISIGYELAWMRSVVFLLGNYTYVFSAVLTVYLLGNVIGAGIGARLSRRLANPAAAFGISLSCLGICGIAYIPWLNTWALGASRQVNEFFGTRLEECFLPLLNSAALFLVPSIAMGIGFPLALQAWGKFHPRVGRSTGTVYGVNTIGAVLGGLLTGFVLIPLVGVQLSMAVLGLAGIWLGAVMLQVFAARIRLVRLAACLAAAAGLTVVAAATPSDLFAARMVHKPGTQTLAVLEGVTTTASVRRTGEGDLELTSDGVPIAGDGRVRCAQKILGHLPILLHGRAEQVLSIGFGGGETTACMARHGVERIDCVEVAPEMTELALRYFRHINLGDLLNRRVNMIYMDGKNYLRLTRRRYDIIQNGANLPFHAGSAPMFGREHFQAALRRLKPGGLFITKLHTNIGKQAFDSILGTFLEVFPHVTLWFPTTRPFPFLYLVGSRGRQTFSPRRIDDQLRIPAVRRSVAYLNFRSSLDVLDCYIGDERDIRRHLRAKAFHPNTDDMPYLEFHYGGFTRGFDVERRRSMMATFLPNLFETVRRDSVLDHLDWSGMPQSEQDRWKAAHGRHYQAAGRVLHACFKNDLATILNDSFTGLALVPGYAALLEQEDQALSSARELIEAGKAGEVLAVTDRLLQRSPSMGAAWLIRSWAMQMQRRQAEGLQAAQNAVRYSPENWRALGNLAGIQLALGRADLAAAAWRNATRLNPTHAPLRLNLAVALTYLGRLDEALVEAKKALEIGPRSAKGLVVLGEIYARLGKKDAAIRSFRKALRIEPELPTARKRLEALSGS